jgi:hypothetical protein
MFLSFYCGKMVAGGQKKRKASRNTERLASKFFFCNKIGQLFAAKNITQDISDHISARLWLLLCRLLFRLLRTRWLMRSTGVRLWRTFRSRPLRRRWESQPRGRVGRLCCMAGLGGVLWVWSSERIGSTSAGPSAR